MNKPVYIYQRDWPYYSETVTGYFEQISWCRNTLGAYGIRWSVTFVKYKNQFRFRQKEDQVLFNLAWYDQLSKKS